MQKVCKLDHITAIIPTCSSDVSLFGIKAANYETLSKFGVLTSAQSNSDVKVIISLLPAGKRGAQGKWN